MTNHRFVNAAVVLLHGKGMRPAALEPFIDSLALPAAVSVPQGPLAHADGSFSWWHEVPPDAGVCAQRGLSRDLFDCHPQGRDQAHQALAAAIDQVGHLHGALPIWLVGFSQGGMLALDYLLARRDPRVAGLALLSCCCIALDEWQAGLPCLQGMPVLVSHGRSDPELAFGAGLRLRDTLLQAGARVEWQAFDGDHEIALVVWKTLSRWLQSVAKLPKWEVNSGTFSPNRPAQI
jgi:predicted esterase